MADQKGNSAPDYWGDWMVMFYFYQGTQPIQYGTGFYINVPQSGYHIIITAGNNLIDIEKRSSRRLKILPNQFRGTPTVPHTAGIYVSRNYRSNPAEENGRNDFGAILIPKEPGDSPRGFGFSMKLDSEELQGKELLLGTLDRPEIDLAPVTRNVKCTSSGKFDLEYQILSGRDWSGAPLIYMHEGRPMAVGIHRRGYQDERQKCIATRFNGRVMAEIFSFFSIGYMSRSLTVYQSTPPPPQIIMYHPSPRIESIFPAPIYLAVTFGTPYVVWVQHGHLKQRSRFDVFPAHGPPANEPDGDISLHVFRLKWSSLSRGKETVEDAVMEGGWAVWDPIKQKVTLADTVQEFSFVRIVPHGTTPNMFHVVLESEKGVEDAPVELRIEGYKSRIVTQSAETGTLKLQLRKYVEGQEVSGEQYNLFSFEQ